MKTLNTLAITAACSAMALTAPAVSADSFSVKLGGRVQMDAAFVDSDNNDSGSEFRRTRFFLKGKGFNGWGYKFQVDINQADKEAKFEDLYLTKDLGGGKAWIGHYHVPFGMEELQSSKYTDFMERSMISDAIEVGRQRAVGYSWNNSNFHYNTSIFSQENTGDDERLGYAVRGVYTPVLTDTNVIHLGAAVVGVESNTPADGLLSYRTNYHLQSTRPRLTIAGDTDSPFRFGLEFAGAWGPVSVKSEYMSMSADGENGADDVDADGAYVNVTYTIGANPAKSYSLSKGGVFGRIKGNGIWQVGGRIDTATFEQGGNEIEADSFTVGGTYIANPYLRFKGEVVFAEADENNVEVLDETVVQFRAQIDF